MHTVYHLACCGSTLTICKLTAGTVHDYAEPYSPLLLHSPRQPVFLTSFDLSGGYLPSQASPPYHSSIHSPTFSTYSQALSGTLGAHDALAQQRQLRAVLSGE